MGSIPNESILLTPEISSISLLASVSDVFRNRIDIFVIARSRRVTNPFSSRRRVRVIPPDAIQYLVTLFLRYLSSCPVKISFTVIQCRTQMFVHFHLKSIDLGSKLDTSRMVILRLALSLLQRIGPRPRSQSLQLVFNDLLHACLQSGSAQFNADRVLLRKIIVSRAYSSVAWIFFFESLVLGKAINA